MAKFAKGHPGGPGRPKMTEEQKQAKAFAKALVERAMGRLEHWMDSDDPKASVSACNSIIDRAEGKPKQEIEATGSGLGQLPPHVVDALLTAIDAIETEGDEPGRAGESEEGIEPGSG